MESLGEAATIAEDLLAKAVSLLEPPLGQNHAIFFALILVAVLSLKFLWRHRSDARAITSKVEAVRKFVVPGQGPRFRKRDRLAFLSRRALRNAKAMGSYIKGGQGRKRRDMARLVRGVFLQRGSPDAQSQMLRPDLPEEYLEEEGGSESGRDGGPGGAGVPEALVLVLKNLRVFGHFDNAMLLELVRGIEHVTLRAGEFLFRVGDPDENMFVVESGSVSVFCEDQQHQREHGSVVELKQVKSGEPIVSLLSFLEHLSGKKGSFRTISARAVAPDTRMIKFSFECFRAAFDKHPENLSRVVQVVMIRLQRVTFLALHQYMGLGSELLRPDHRGAPGEENSEEVQTEQDMRERASNLFRKALGLIDVEGLENGETDLCRNISLITCAADEVLVQEETVDRNLLLLVLRGCVSVSQAPAEGGVTNISGSAVEIHRAYVGGLLGQLQTLTAEPSFFTYRSMSSGTVVAALPAAKVRAVMARQPQVALALASSVISNLSPHVRSIDFSLEWSLLESGRALYKQDTRADSIYVVLSGRLRSVIRSQGGRRELAAEYGRGELTGIVETLMKTPHATTVIAVRDTEVAKLPAGLIDFIKLRFPKVLMTLIKLLGRKLQQSIEGGPGTDLKSLPQRGHHAAAQSNFSTVALIPITRQLPAAPFALELLHALAEIDPALRLTKDYVRSELGSDAFDRANDFKLSSWLAAQEDKHRIVLYQCDPELTSWTKLCVRHADVVFILLDSTHKRGIYPIEHSLEAYSPRTRKELIFLHREDVKYPTGTQDWLKDRAWINGHHHMRCPRRVYSQPKTEASYLRQLPSPPDVHSDFSRLARWVTGTSVGLVLGGGGARGCSHVGMVKAILEAGVPIDTVAGVSIGSFIGALWCQERDITAVTDKARRFSFKMNQWWRQLLDLTYPYTSYFSGRGFNTLLEEVFEARDIRDLWLPYFTVTTDITESAMRVHDYGSLWRYVRSSMSLAGYVPPLCDPHDGHLLLDGGYVNNLPADLMRARGARHIMAIDVGAQDEASFTNYGDDLSGFQVMWSRWNPLARSPALLVPNHADVQSRLAYVSCVGKLEAVKSSDYCDYIRPPIDRYGTLQFGSFDEIRDVGYYHGKTYFAGLKRAGLLRQFLGPVPTPFSETSFFSLPGSIRRNSLEHGALMSSPLQAQSNFGQLAEAVCSVRRRPRSRSSVARALESQPIKQKEEIVVAGGGDCGDENLITDEEDDTESGFLSQI